MIEFLQKIFRWPNSGKSDLSSTVWILNKDIKYLPLVSEININYTHLNKFFIFYIAIWFIIITSILILPYFFKKSLFLELTTILKSQWLYFFIGFLIGFLFLCIHTIYPSLSSALAIVKNPNPQLQIINSPEIKNYNPNNPNLTDYINPNSIGDFKILLENKIFPSNNTTGYLITAKTFLEAEKNNKIKSVTLTEYLNKECNDCLGYNPDDNIQQVTFKDRLESMASSGFYLTTLMLTYGLYISDITEKKNEKYTKFLFLMICLIILITLMENILGYTLPGNETIINYNNLLQIKQFLLIIAISFSITTILIV